MATIDDFSRLVAGIYSAVMAPEQWDVTMADIGRAFDGSSAALVITDGKTRTLKHADIPPDAATNYADHFARLDHVLSAVETGPVGAVRTGTELMWPHQNCEFQTDWARRNGFEDGLFIRLTGAPSATSLAVATSMRSAPFDTAERVALARRLVPHLQQALRTQYHLEDLGHRGNDLAGASEAVRHGVVVVTRGHRVVYTNSAAERILRADDGLRNRSTRIEAGSLRVDAQLQHGIDRALASNNADGCGSSFLCARPSERRPYVVHVLPLDETTFASPPAQNRAMIVIVDPELEPEPAASLLRRLYGLTRSEADAALMVLRGQGRNHIADELSLSLATVKTHLQHVFDKTGTHRQAELVRLLLSLDPLCR
jgi:DNA-binding CsgD family transcriptional regulator/PAS domain-containing protein